MPSQIWTFSSFAFNATNVPGSQASGTFTTIDWGFGAVNPGCLSGVGDNNTTSASTLGAAFTTNYLYGSDFRFDPSIHSVISSGIELTGINVRIYRSSSADLNTSQNNDVRDYSLRLFSGSGNLIGNNKASPTLWPLTNSPNDYDFSPADWGVDPLTYPNIRSEITSSGFGAGLQVQDTDGGVNQSFPTVDAFELILTFSSGQNLVTGGFPLFIGGLASGNSALPLFIDGGPHVSRCYGPFYPKTVSTICGSGATSWVNPTNIFNLDNARTTSSMTSGDARSCQILSFFNISGISNQAQISGVIFNFYKQQNAGDDSVIDEQVYLIQHGIVESGANYAGGIWGIDSHNPVSYSTSTNQFGARLTINDITASGFGVLMQAATNNFGMGTAQIDTVTCTVCATVPGITNSIPLFLDVSNNASGNLPLFINGLVNQSGSIPLYMNGLSSISGNLPLFINGLLSNSGSIPLYLQSNSFATGNLPLYIEGNKGQSGNLTLYLQGPPTFPIHNSIPLYLGNFSSSGNLDSLRKTIPLFLDAHNFGQGITLYLGVSNIGTPSNSMTLFTKGAAFNSQGSIPLFLSNSGLTHSIPLYVKGLSYGTNPYINTDGYYPIEGGITLFITTGSEENSMPLYIGANFSASGNIPMFLAANNMVSSGIPLFMATSQPINKAMPLYHHGF